MSMNIYSRLRLLKFLKINYNLRSIDTYYSPRLCSSAIPKKKKLEDYFFNKDVQSILRKITGLDYEKIFRPRNTEKIVPDKFEFVTEEKLEEMKKNAYEKAMAKLQMPPVMDLREPIDEVLSKDPELQYYVESKLLFVDTSPGKSARNRVITVRELDGTLRKANWDERFKMNQIFFPIEGRELETPKLFESPYLDKLLEEETYEFILDAACTQFEPDDPEYHRITNATYEHIKSRKMFDALRSTRHFGPMAFYFAVKKDINGLLVDMLERLLISDAADTIKLLYILNPDLGTSVKEMDDIDYVKGYVQEYKSPKTSDLELALQTYLEVQQMSEVEKASS